MGIETTNHFLLYCQFYAEERNTLFRVTDPLLESMGLFFLNDNHRVNFLLYGHKNLDVNKNRIVLNATIKYIHDSKRFESIEQ